MAPIIPATAPIMMLTNSCFKSNQSFIFVPLSAMSLFFFTPTTTLAHWPALPKKAPKSIKVVTWLTSVFDTPFYRKMVRTGGGSPPPRFEGKRNPTVLSYQTGVPDYTRRSRRPCFVETPHNREPLPSQWPSSCKPRRIVHSRCNDEHFGYMYC